jgi:hypothetical protein
MSFEIDFYRFARGRLPPASLPTSHFGFEPDISDARRGAAGTVRLKLTR